jgi:hypothetical membrane protein
MAASIALPRPVFWTKTAFQIVIGCILAFIALTTLAMFIYPGGTSADKTTTGYQFFTNFFSDLGRTVAHNGAPNGVASLLFTVAMISAGSGLALFFVAFARFFTRPVWMRVVSLIATAIGVFTGLCFIGVGFTPANVSGPAHGLFVLSAFTAFLVTAVLYSVVILADRGYPNRYAWPFVVFAALLAAYLYLITQRPQIADLPQVVIQATGQKIIVYASLISILLQSVAAQRVATHSASYG